MPWKRLGEDAHNIFDFFNYFSAVVLTLLMRIVGVCIRSIVIVVGLVAILLAIPFGLILLIVWLAMPVLLVILLIVGWKLLIKQF